MSKSSRRAKAQRKLDSKMGNYQSQKNQVAFSKPGGKQIKG
jgi:hypothetical protein